jgi:AAA+ ATPase superfamily predicted ATPase
MKRAPATSRVIGRKDEQEKFSKALASAESEFIAVYGRRRVGKTFLIREFFSESLRFELTGMQGVSLQDQLVNFAGALAKAKGLSETLQRPGRRRLCSSNATSSPYGLLRRAASM